jgi:hypothetical protein
MNLQEYVIKHTIRGDCTCGKCIDAPRDPKQPEGHTANLVFFKVAKQNDPKKEDLLNLIKQHNGEFCDINLFDGKEHSYIEIGAWIGDQGLALLLMGLGSLLEIWDLLTPMSMFNFTEEDPTTKRMIGMGYLSIIVKI